MIKEVINIRSMAVASSENELVDVIKNVRFSVELTDSETGRTAGTVGRVTIALPEQGFIPYADVTEENVISWIKDTQDYADIVQKLTNNLIENEIIKSVHAGNFPWIPVVEAAVGQDFEISIEPENTI